ncbi:hypothetical protein AB0L00_08385 [Actinoallomurus sp. NPDC052308]|uniref:hypothetical protein n=1 Tax=Actinoallomurus sp. NPDC052308 TaxID=3155530 RepID=UPI003441D2A8
MRIRRNPDRTDLAPVCPLADIDLLITGDGADEAALSRLRDRGLSSEVAQLSDRP